MKFRTLLISAILCSVCLPTFAENVRRDGNWWRDEAESTRALYVIGFFDGMRLGSELTWKNIHKENGKTTPAARQARDAFDTAETKFFANITSGQVADGLTSFYEDYRNRTITVDRAVWLVVNTIAGTSDQDIMRMIDYFKKHPN